MVVDGGYLSATEAPEGTVYEPLSGEFKPVEPCPFCGCKTVTAESADGACVLTCWNCKARGPAWDYREERAIASWNSRVTSSG